jgi:hypothetical protein
MTRCALCMLCGALANQPLVKMPPVGHRRLRRTPRSAPEVYLNLATTMSKVQITPMKTNAVNPIRIHCSGVRCFQLISGLVLPAFSTPLAISFLQWLSMP